MALSTLSLDVVVVELFRPLYYVLDSSAGSRQCRSLKNSLKLGKLSNEPEKNKYSVVYIIEVVYQVYQLLWCRFIDQNPFNFKLGQERSFTSSITTV